MKGQSQIERDTPFELDGISAWRHEFDRWFLSIVTRVSAASLRRWLLIANGMNAAVLAGAALAPVMMASGHRGIASLLFWSYQALCSQNPGHSYFLQGYQIALDQRMTAIYGSFLLMGLAFACRRRSIRPLPWRAFFLSMIPIAIDGLTQLFGWRHSTWELRTLTGGLFGAATVWLAYPRLDIAFSYTLSDLTAGRSSPEPVRRAVE